VGSAWLEADRCLLNTASSRPPLVIQPAPEGAFSLSSAGRADPVANPLKLHSLGREKWIHFGINPMLSFEEERVVRKTGSTFPHDALAVLHVSVRIPA
jgi:hypothetical protein